MDVSRRRAMATIGGGIVVGTIWTAPKVTGLSLRPDYAHAQSAPATTTTTSAPGSTVFDLVESFILPLIDGSGWAGSSNGLAPGVDFAYVERNRVSQDCDIDACFPTNPYLVFGSIQGPAVGVNCSILGIDGSVGGALDMTGLTSAPSSQRVVIWNPPGVGVVTLHVLCT